MDSAADTPAAFRADQLIAPLLDLGVIAAFIWGIPLTAAWLAEPRWPHAVIIFAAYLAMCVGVVLARRIERPAAAADTTERSMGCTAGLALPFGAFVVLLIMQSSGVLDDATPWVAALRGADGGGIVLGTVGSLLVILVFGLFPWAMLFTPARLIPAGSPRAALQKFTAVVLINTMALVTAAYFHSEFSGLEPMNLAIGGRILVFACSYVFFLLFYAPPRLALIEVEGNRHSLWSFLIMLALFVWPLTA